jgi:hypothetical protein
MVNQWPMQMMHISSLIKLLSEDLSVRLKQLRKERLKKKKTKA